MRDSTVEIMAYMGKLCSSVLHGFFIPMLNFNKVTDIVG